MTREQVKRKIEDILYDIQPYAHDDSGLYIPLEEIEKAVEKIMELWDFGFTYNFPTEKSSCGCSRDLWIQKGV